MPRVDERCSNNHECNDNDGTDTTIETNEEVNQLPLVLWQVLYENIPPVPLYAPLERMSVKTNGGVSLRTLTTQISEFMTRNDIFWACKPAGCIDCSRGVAATAAIAAIRPGYRSRRSTSSVGSMCTSITTNSDNVLKFIVQLWRENGDDNGGVIVEVQRRRGCCISMRETRRQLYNFLARNGCHHSLVSRGCNGTQRRRYSSNSTGNLFVSSAYQSLGTTFLFPPNKDKWVDGGKGGIFSLDNPDGWWLTEISARNIIFRMNALYYYLL